MTPKQECEMLLDALLPAAEHLLKKNGEFYPIAAVLTADSQVQYTAVHEGDEYPDAQGMIDRFIQAHRELAAKNEIKASGIAWNAAISAEEQKSDAIIISLEHRDGYSVIVGQPYQMGRFRKIKLGELFAQDGCHDVFS